MEFVALESHACHLLVGYSDLGGVGSPVKLCPHRQAGARGCGGDEFHDHLVANQRTPSPIHADMREESMLNLFHLLVPGGK